MRNLLTTLAFAATLLSGCRKADRRVPAPAPQPPAADERAAFTPGDGTNALAEASAFVSDCTPRDAGTPGAKAAADWIATRLAACGVPASIDAFADQTPSGTQTFYNITATIDGARPGRVLLLSHFDTKRGISPSFEGANDGGSSTGLLLALASLYEHAPLASHPTVAVAFLDGEEAAESYGPHDGLHGSRHLAAKFRQAGVSFDAVILLDMVGDSDLRLSIPHNGAGNLRALALSAADATGIRDRVSLMDGDVLDDHQPFLDAGYPAVDLIDFTYGSGPGLNDYWHTPADTLDKLSAASLGMTGALVAEMVGRIVPAQK